MMVFLSSSLCLYFISSLAEIAAVRLAHPSSVCQQSTCSCTSVDADASSIDEVSCRLVAITPDDIVITSLQNQPIKRLRLTCLDRRSLSTISSETLGSLPVLESLSVENCNFESGLTSNSFQDMKNLTALELSRCVLPQSSAGNDKPQTYLSALSHLVHLSVTGCNLYHQPALPRWDQLQHLNVSYNNLHTLHFAPGVDGEHDQLGGVSDELAESNAGEDFSDTEDSDRVSEAGSRTHGAGGPTALRVMDISHNPMTSLPTAAVVLSPQLERLIMQGVALAEFHLPENFEMPELVAMDARDSALNRFNFTRLGSSRKLEELYLTGAGSPVELPDLSSLTQLRNVKLVKLGVRSSIWPQLTSPVLWRLDLTGNNISSVNTHRLPGLKVLLLGKNQIAEVHATSSFGNLPNLQGLNISYNLISELPITCFHGSESLLALDASHNNLTRVQSGTFRNLSRALYFNLAHNAITSLGYTLFEDTTAVLHLFLQYNSLTFLPQLNSMTHLQWLNVSYNEIRSLEPRHLDGLSRLTVLHANNNALTRLSPDLLTHTPILLEAWLNDNSISFLGDMGRHENLLNLRLENNKIPNFFHHSPFRGLSSLQVLSLENNYLTTLYANTFPPSVQTLFLGLNFFSFLRSDSFSGLSNLEHVQLINNRKFLSMPGYSVNKFGNNHPKPHFIVGGVVWWCDCWMAYLKLIYETRQQQDQMQLFQMYYPVFEQLENTRCAVMYETEALRPFVEVPLSDFVCDYPDLYCATDCKCCDRQKIPGSPEDPSCPCQLTCPVGCKCYIAGDSSIQTYYHIRCDRRLFTSVPERIPQMAVNLYLDGNNISSIAQPDLDRLTDLEKLYLNSSAVATVGDGAFQNCTSLVSLHLDYNLLTTIDSVMFKGLANLVHLYLHYNRIEEIALDAFESLVSVREVTLHNNMLTKLASPLDSLPSGLDVLTLSRNPWRCDCEDSRTLVNFLHVRTKSVIDKESMCCHVPQELQHSMPTSVSEPEQQSNTLSDAGHDKVAGPFPSSETAEETSFNMLGSDISTDSLKAHSTDKHSSSSSSLVCKPVLKLNFSEICVSDGHQRLEDAGMPTVILVLVVLFVVLILAASLVVVAIFKRKELQAFAFVKLGIRVFDNKVQLDKTDAGSKAFDAFISYSSKDDDFVAGTLVPTLEDPGKGYRVCVHYRDFPVGQTITDTICRAIECSSRTILLLTQNFLKSEWCRFEFQAAHRHILKKGSHRLVIVTMGDVPGDMLDEDLKVHLKSRSYLRFEDPWFWEKLYFSLPDIRHRKAQAAEDAVDGHVGDEEEGAAATGGERGDAEAMTVIRAMRALAGKSAEDVRGVGEATA